QNLAVLDIKAYRSQILLIHTAVHGKTQRTALIFEVRGECCESPIRLAIAVAPIGTQGVLCKVEAANDVRRALEGLAAARLGPACYRRSDPQQRRYPKSNNGRGHGGAQRRPGNRSASAHEG